MSDESGPAETFLGLRDIALRTTAENIQPISGFTLGRVSGAIMETGRENGIASLVAFADGTTSLYFSTGGGVMGAGGQENVRDASSSFLAEAESMLDLLTPASQTPLPGRGCVRFYVHTTDGLMTAEANEQDLGHGRHQLSTLFHAGQAVIGPILFVREEETAAEGLRPSKKWWQVWKR